MPVWPGVQTTAQQDHLASLLHQVHIDKVDCFKQLSIKDCGGSVIKEVMFYIAGIGCIKHLRSSNLTTLLTVCRNVPRQLFMHEQYPGHC